MSWLPTATIQGTSDATGSVCTKNWSHTPRVEQVTGQTEAAGIRVGDVAGVEVEGRSLGQDHAVDADGLGTVALVPEGRERERPGGNAGRGTGPERVEAGGRTAVEAVMTHRVPVVGAGPQALQRGVQVVLHDRGSSVERRRPQHPHLGRHALAEILGRGADAHERVPDLHRHLPRDGDLATGARTERQVPAVGYGNRMAAWIAANHKQLGVRYIIWRQRIWNVERASEGWRPMSDRGNPTANHYDHLHVSTYGDAAKPVEPDTGGSDVRAVMPVERYTITARFGQVGSWARYHTGLDFAAAIGTPVRAALGGTVTHAGYRSTASWAGDFVTVRHSDGTSTLYAHLARHDIRPGQSVATGQQIGAIGMSGRSFGPHLHFEVYPPNVSPGRVYSAVDPTSWLRSHDASQG